MDMKSVWAYFIYLFIYAEKDGMQQRYLKSKQAHSGFRVQHVVTKIADYGTCLGPEGLFLLISQCLNSSMGQNGSKLERK